MRQRESFPQMNVADQDVAGNIIRTSLPAISRNKGDIFTVLKPSDGKSRLNTRRQVAIQNYSRGRNARDDRPALMSVAYPTLSAPELLSPVRCQSCRDVEGPNETSSTIQQIQSLRVIKIAATATWRPEFAISKLAIESNRTYNRD